MRLLFAFTAFALASPSAQAQSVIDDSAKRVGERVIELSLKIMKSAYPPGLDFAVSDLHVGKGKNLCGRINFRDSLGRLGEKRFFVLSLDQEEVLTSRELNVPLASREDGLERQAVLAKIIERCGG